MGVVAPRVVEAMRDRRVEEHGVPGPEREVVAAHRHLQLPPDDDPELPTAVVDRRVRRSRLSAGLVDRVEELDVLLVPRREALPPDAGLELDRRTLRDA